MQTESFIHWLTVILISELYKFYFCKFYFKYCNFYHSNLVVHLHSFLLLISVVNLLISEIWVCIVNRIFKIIFFSIKTTMINANNLDFQNICWGICLKNYWKNMFYYANPRFLQKINSLVRSLVKLLAGVALLWKKIVAVSNMLWINWKNRKKNLHLSLV